MKRSFRTVRERFRGVLHLDDPPWKIALGLAVGVFISCTPFYFFQTILAIIAATVLRLNVAVTVAGTWINLPWFAPFVYAGALKLGALIVPSVEGLSGLSIALLVGTTIVGVAAAVLTWVVAVALISWRRARRERTDHPESHAA